MKSFFIGKLAALLLIISLLLTMSGLSACQRQQELQPMSFEISYSDKDTEEALALIRELEDYIDAGKNLKIISKSKAMEDKLDYLYHEYIVSEMKYYSDLADETAYDTYITIEDAFMTVQEESLRTLQKLYSSRLPAKAVVFYDWTEAELADMEVPSEAVVALEKRQKELMREYLALEEPESEAWSDALEEIYFRSVDTAQQLAAIYGYENFYEYAANDIYMRRYSDEQRQAFRQNVKEYILPFYIEVQTRYEEMREELSEEQDKQFLSLRKDPCQPSNEYLSGYIESYGEKMSTIMAHLFDREAVLYTQSENAYDTAYTNYSEYCAQPFVYLGNNCQDILTLVHELGHYAAFYHFTDATLPYDTGEVHSQGNEWLMMWYLDGMIDPDVYETLLLWRLRGGLETVILSTLVDEYEEEIYCHREVSSPEELEGIMYELMDGYEGIEHIESKEGLYTYAQYVTMEAPVYYLSYATSELASMSLYALAEEEGYEKAQEIYTELCLETPTDNDFFESLADVGLPDPFESDTVLRIVESFESVLAERALAPAA